MRARLSSWLLLSLVVLAALVAAELRFEAGVGSGHQPVDRGSTPAAVSPAPLFALAERESFSETLTRPLFMPNRKPLAAVVEESPVPVAPAARANANRYALSAIIIFDDERIALLTDTATGDLHRVREGERIAGWQVEKIHKDGAVLSNGDTREELALRSFGPPAPRPVSPSRRTATQRKAAAQSAGKKLGASPDRPRRPKRRSRPTGRIPGTEAN
jgi:hypothetical protein